eukprot:TRINITY_DN1059_c0_g2_i2.p1 TRINITY_DN1059_c0_g2~~TRINITY_DN1059_c0_g2_i2.p1  ORF type:complete len:285 (-),score=90.35 TRINITY_DN1059_c0_g2_i2:388-1242(-)
MDDRVGATAAPALLKGECQAVAAPPSKQLTSPITVALPCFSLDHRCHTLRAKLPPKVAQEICEILKQSPFLTKDAEVDDDVVSSYARMITYTAEFPHDRLTLISPQVYQELEGTVVSLSSNATTAATTAHAPSDAPAATTALAPSGAPAAAAAAAAAAGAAPAPQEKNVWADIASRHAEELRGLFSTPLILIVGTNSYDECGEYILEAPHTMSLLVRGADAAGGEPSAVVLDTYEYETAAGENVSRVSLLALRAFHAMTDRFPTRAPCWNLQDPIPRDCSRRII